MCQEGYTCVSHVEYSKEAVQLTGEQAELDLHKTRYLYDKQNMSETAKEVYLTCQEGYIYVSHVEYSKEAGYSTCE